MINSDTVQAPSRTPMLFGRFRAWLVMVAVVVILCGLITSTLLNMFVVPALYLRYGR